jgi:hypothetical protein
MRRWLLCTLGPCLLELACDARPDVARFAERAQPHLAEFAQFDRWARRAGVSDRVQRDRAALDETTFAPIRGDRAIAAAWVELEGKHGFTLAFPANAALPAPVDWVGLRDPDLGPLRVAAIEHCEQLLPHATHALSSTQCVLISRSAPSPPPLTTTVTLAFEAPISSASP